MQSYNEWRVGIRAIGARPWVKELWVHVVDIEAS